MTKNNHKTIKIFHNKESAIEVPYNTSLIELSKKYEKKYKSVIVAAKVNNEIRELSYKLTRDCEVVFIDTTVEDGIRIYRRSIYFILIKAAYELFPEISLMLSHTVHKGLFIEIKDGKKFSEADLEKIKTRMKEITKQKIPFTKETMPFYEAKKVLLQCNRTDRLDALEYRDEPYATIYDCGGFKDYFYGYMMPDTGYIRAFDLINYPPGIILLPGDNENLNLIPKFKEQKKLFKIFLENEKWCQILEVKNVGQLNKKIKEEKGIELIRLSEALQEKKIAMIADMITENSQKKSLVLISGPSSSGKTTFAQRLRIQLKVNGYDSFAISLDDYFVNRNDTPKDEKGEADYESIEAIDLKLFNEQLQKIINGEEVETPVFDFESGKRSKEKRKVKLNENQIVIIEGIHSLNERLTKDISHDVKFKIFVSALTSMNIDDHNRIPTTDTRIIRRIVRDYNFRASKADSTIKRWASVRRNEEKNIFPYQEEADVMFNSALVYEHCVLKKYALPILCQVDCTANEYSEAKRLISFLSYFLQIDPKEIPVNSIIREFIGDSCFYQ